MSLVEVASEDKFVDAVMQYCGLHFSQQLWDSDTSDTLSGF